MDFLYDSSDDQIRTFVTNGFYPDGVCYEATGGYNAGHIEGAYDLDEQLTALARQRPDRQANERWPAVTDDPRFARIARPPIETIMCGKAVAAYGDDRAPGAMAEGASQRAQLTAHLHCWLGWVNAASLYRKVVQHQPLPLYDRVRSLFDACRDAQRDRQQRHDSAQAHHCPSLLLDHGGIGILRLRRQDGTDHAAAFCHYISQPFHRHDDFLDVSLVAFDRMWSPDLGYPARHETCPYWEGNWATHNRGKIVDGLSEDVVGTGGCELFADTEVACVIDLAGVEGQFHDWRLWQPQDKHHRRLLVLIPTVGEGTVLVDLLRLRGGKEHWRSYLGTPGTMTWTGPERVARGGTAGGADVARGEREKAGTEKAGLALIDAIQEGSGDAPWTATNVCEDDPDWVMSIHGAACSPGTRAMLGRGGHPMTTPEDSPYRFSPLLLYRDADGDEWSSFDLVFEPHHQSPTIRTVSALPARDSTSGASLWNPFSTAPAGFVDGSKLTGSVAVLREPPGDPSPGQCLLALGGALHTSAANYCADRAAAAGTVVALGDDARKAMVRPAPGAAFAAGMRVRVLPRGHWQEVEAVARVEGVADGEVILHARLPLAWAGYFRACTMAAQDDSWRVPVVDVRMREDTPRCYGVLEADVAPAMLAAIRPGDWVDFLDYVPGDAVLEVDVVTQTGVS
jgi:hypothetical protein